MSSTCSGNCSSCSSTCNSEEKLENRLSVIQNKLLVLSGKGGVGKSTVAASLALTLARRILPLRDRIWKWESCRGENGESCRLVQEPARHPARVRICGQRGLSFARLEQLEEFRKRIQSLNRNLMRRAGAAPQRPSEMRELRIPDPCPDVLRKLNQMKENRINQTANLILSQALGLRLKGCARGNRPEEIHGS